MKGYRRIGPDQALRDWAEAALPFAIKVLRETDQTLHCGGTWAVGLDLLPNAPDGSVGGVALPWAVLGLPPNDLHLAQLSTTFPGYPQPSPDETPAAYGFRLRRDAAHVDGLLAIGPDKRRMIQEPHGWILGLPLNDPSPGAAPLVVWEGSHLVMQAALRAVLMPYPKADWDKVDITEAYQTARVRVFETCRRVELPAKAGEATLLHRLLVHGVAPWGLGATAPPEGRIIAYFRPALASVADWIERP